MRHCSWSCSAAFVRASSKPHTPTLYPVFTAFLNGMAPSTYNSDNVASRFCSVYTTRQIFSFVPPNFSQMGRLSRWMFALPGQRRVLCDEGRPACQRCIHRNEICEGYRDESSLIFRNETNKVIQHSRTTQATSSSSLTPLRTNAASPSVLARLTPCRCLPSH